MSAVNMLLQTPSNMCRLCMSTNSSLNDIFTANGSIEEASIATQIVWLTQLSINIGDGLPSKVCSRCIILLNAALDFIKQCVYSDKTLRGMAYYGEARVSSVKPEIIPESICSVVDTSVGIKVETMDVLNEDDENTFNANIEEASIVKEESTLCAQDNYITGTNSPPDSNMTRYSHQDVNLDGNADDYRHPADLCRTHLGPEPSDVNASSSKPVAYEHTLGPFPPADDYRHPADLCRTHLGPEPSDVNASSSKPVAYEHTLGPFPLAADYRHPADLCRTHLGPEPSDVNASSSKPVAYEHTLGPFPHVDDYRHPTDLCRTHLGPEPSDVNASSSKPVAYEPALRPFPPAADWYECEFCGKSFEKKMSLASHLKKHTRTTQLKSYSCEECGLNFINKVEQAVHNIRHTGVKPFPCPSCDKAFSRMDSLRKHTRIHTKERPYKCSMCPNLYSQKWTLRLHERRHLGVMPHRCDHCSRSFCDPSNLRAHISRKHTEGKPVRKYTQSKMPRVS